MKNPAISRFEPVVESSLTIERSSVAENSDAVQSSSSVSRTSLTASGQHGEVDIAVTLQRLELSFVWVLAGLVLLIIHRYPASWWKPAKESRAMIAANGRTIARLFIAGAVWAVLFLLWEVRGFIFGNESPSSWDFTATGGSMVISGALFTSLREWIGKSSRQVQTGKLFDRIKPILPQLLAYLTLALAVVLTMQCAIWLLTRDW